MYFLRSGHGNDVAFLEAKTKEVLGAAVGIKSTIDIDLSSFILYSPVTIDSINYLGDGTCDHVGLAFRACDNISTCDRSSLEDTLNNIDVLPAAG